MVPEWGRHLVFALLMAAVVVGGAVALTLFGLVPLSATATGGWVDVVRFTIIGG